MIRLLLVFLGIPLGIALAVYGGIGAVNASGLQSQGKVVEATITQSKTGEQNAYEIQYEFRLGDGATAYSHSDETGRRNLWVTVSEKPTANTVEVRYLPSNPWVNGLANGTSSSLGSALTALGVGVLFACVGLFLLISDIRRWLRKRSPQASA